MEKGEWTQIPCTHAAGTLATEVAKPDCLILFGAIEGRHHHSAGTWEMVSWGIFFYFILNVERLYPPPSNQH